MNESRIRPPGPASGRVRRFVTLVAMTACIAMVGPQPGSAADVVGPVTISEFVAINPGPHLDEDGESSDWLELHNATGATVSLAGWTLRDGGAIWALPAIDLAADARLVVWASGKNRSVAGSELHASFRLSGGGEYLGLHDADGLVVSAFSPNYPPQTSGVAYGVASDGTIGSLAEPTPGLANAAAAMPETAAPTAQLGNRTTDVAVTEVLTSATPGASIHYTLDGSDPTAASPIAAGGSVTISPTSGVTSLRAIAVAAGHSPSAIATFTYVHPTSAATAIGGGADVAAGIASLPVVVLTRPGGINAVADYEATRIDYVDPDGPGFSAEAGARRFGAWSLGKPKQNYRINFSGDFGPTQLDYPLFSDRGQGVLEPATSFDQFELRAYSLDSFAGPYPLHVSNEFARELTLALGTPSSHGRPVGVVLNGTYVGQYQLRERINEDWLASYFGGDGGDYESWFIDDVLNTTDLHSGTGEVFTAIDQSTSWQQVDDLVDPRALVNSALTLWNYSNYSEKEWRLAGPSDPAHPRGFVWIPNDMDLAFTQRHRAGRSIGHRDFLPRFAADPEFLEILHDQAALAFCDGGPMTLDAMYARYDRLVDEIRAAIPAEIEAWDWPHTQMDWQSNVDLGRSRIAPGLTKTVDEWQAAGWFAGCGRAPVPELATTDAFVQHRSVGFAVSAPDPDGDAVTITASGLPPGLAMGADGTVTGTPTTVGDFSVTVRATDVNGQWTEADAIWTVVDAPAAAADAPVRVNEINLVNDGDGWAGADEKLGVRPDNGGDWFELVVIEAEADLRGWSVELWDREGFAEVLALRDRFTFADHPVLASLPEGTLITVAESVADDATLVPHEGDFHLNANASNAGTSVLLEPLGRSNFDTTGDGFRVVLRDPAGLVHGDFVGLTESWVSARGAPGVGVFSSCQSTDDAAAVVHAVEPVTSTFGAANVCGGIEQALEDRRAYQPYGDVNCDGVRNIVDALVIAQYTVDIREGAGCPHGDPGANLTVANADANGDGAGDIVDSLLIARCEVGIPNPVCP